MNVPKFRNGTIELLDDAELAEHYQRVTDAVGVGSEAREFEREAAKEIDRRDMWVEVYGA